MKTEAEIRDKIKRMLYDDELKNQLGLGILGTYLNALYWVLDEENKK